MLHLWSGYDLTLSLYKHVQNDCQIYRPLGFILLLFLYTFGNAASLELLLWRCTLPGLYCALDAFSFCPLLW